VATSLSIIVPVYNEERTIVSVMDTLSRVCGDAQLVYVDDGSRDRSLELLRQHARPQDTVLTKENGGKGSAIRLGLQNATGDYTVIQDADLEYDPADIARLLAEALAHPGTAVFGSRFLQANPNLYKRYLLGNKAITAVVNILYGSHLTDSYTCYKLFPTAMMKELPLSARGFELEAELCAYPLKRGVEIREIPISYKPRSLEEGKKIRWKDAVTGARTLLRIRFAR
jgi:glycosyltransferase involved in cell wall biosynthesis